MSRRMLKVEFRLSMPRVGSWDGGWSGSGRNYSIVKSLNKDRAGYLLKGRTERSWIYAFGDGWTVEVSARVVPKGERQQKSDGFMGYEWMVRSILSDGEIYGPARPKPSTEVAS